VTRREFGIQLAIAGGGGRGTESKKNGSAPGFFHQQKERENIQWIGIFSEVSNSTPSTLDGVKLKE